MKVLTALFGPADAVPQARAVRAVISDEVLHTIAACGTPREVAARVRERTAAVGPPVDTVCLYQTGPIDPEALAGIIDELG